MDYTRIAKLNASKDPGMDDCQTPPYALDPLLPYLPKGAWIWESACGEGFLASALYDNGFTVTATDLITGQDYFMYEPLSDYSIQVTNPPFSLKYPWYKRAYKLGKPFALLMQNYVFGSSQAQALWQRYGYGIILLDARIDFKMPNKGWGGKGAHFSVSWFTWGLGFEGLRFGHIDPIKKKLWNEEHAKESE